MDTFSQCFQQELRQPFSVVVQSVAIISELHAVSEVYGERCPKPRGQQADTVLVAQVAYAFLQHLPRAMA